MQLRSDTTVTLMPRPGSLVRWRDLRHVHILGWDECYGLGPFEVVRMVDHSADEIPPGVVLRTKLGEREINSVWLTIAGEPGEIPAQGRFPCPANPT